MKYISKDNIEEFLDYLSSKELRQEEIENLNLKFEFNGEVVEYSVILNYIDKLSFENRDILHGNVKYFKKSFTDLLDDKILKILDYVLLEIPRSNKFSMLETQLKKSELVLRELRTAERESNNRMKDHESKMERIQGDFISILSIFSAVIIAFFGGISVMGSVFSHIHKISRYKLVFIILIIGFIMFNLIYMLLHSISKLTGKNIGVNVLGGKCYGCNENYFIKCLATKYPVVFVYNILTVIICFITFITYILDKYNFITYIIKKLKFIPDEFSLIPIVAFSIVLFFSIIAYFICKKFKVIKKITCHSRQCKGLG